MKGVWKSLQIRSMNMVLHMPLKLRIICLYVLFTVLLLGIINVITFNVTLGMLKQKENSILDDSMTYLIDQVEQRYERLGDQFVSLFSEKQYVDLIARLKQGQTTYEKSILSSDFVQYFQEIHFKNQDALESILLADKFGNTYSDQFRPRYEHREFIRTEYYETAQSNKNIMTFVKPSAPLLPPAIVRSFYFTNHYEIGYESEQSEDYHVLVFILRNAYLQKMVDGVSRTRQVKAMITDSRGNIVIQSPGLKEWEENRIVNNTLSLPLASVSGTIDTLPSGNRFMVSNKAFAFTDWQLWYVYDESILYKDAGSVSHILFIITIVSLVCIIFIAIFISRTVTSPLQRLQATMEKAKEGELEISIPIHSRDEIGSLYKHFNRMMRRIQDLVDRIKMDEQHKRERELQALQAQINPHFLYNTLDTIYWKLKIAKNDELAELVADLGGFFRLSLNKGQEITTVSKEIEHVVKYMNIQQVRYSNRFEYQVLNDSKILGHKLPKLILQPIIENCIIHGFEDIEHSGQIIIRSEVAEDSFSIIIEDNGKGIPEHILNQLPGNSCAEGSEIGYALRNVNERIQLYAGSAYGLCITCRSEGGTCVKVTLPTA